jgi:apolipoprotein N-acyltransferase
MKTSTRILLGIALGALSALLLVLSFQPVSLWPLVFFAYVPLLLGGQRILPQRWSGLASAIGIGGFLVVFLTALFGVNRVTWIFLLIAGLIAMLSVITAPGLRAFHARTGYRWFILHGAADAAAIEFIRSFIPPVHTHAFFAQTVYSQPWLLQPVSIFGTYGLTALILMINYALALALLLAFDRRWRLDELPAIDQPAARRGLASSAILAAAWIGLSLGMLATAPKDAPVVRVAAIQHGYNRPGHVDADTQVERLAVLAEQTRLAAAQGAKLAVWPELGLGFDPQVEHTAELKTLAAATGMHLLIGYGVEEGEDWRNEAVLLTPQGEFLQVYGKQFASFGEPRIATAGPYPVYNTPLGRLATIICNDVNFPQATRTLANNGAQLVTVPTFESGAAGLGWEQRTQVPLRAVQHRLAVVKADSAGISMIVDPYGRILAHVEKPAGEGYALVADVPLGTGKSLYNQIGDWVGYLGLAGLVAFSMATNRKQNAPRPALAAR